MNGLMTGTMRLPLAPNTIPMSLMVVAQNAIAVAWHRLLDAVQEGGFSICRATEDEITEALHIILGEIHAADEEAVSGFSLFEMPVREGNLRNHNGRRLDCQPDLTFRPLRGAIPTTNSALVGIFVECKPIDREHPVPSTYCKEGLIRFVNGDYAWAVDRAMMVGYVRNNCSLPTGLAHCTENDRTNDTYSSDGYLTAAAATILGEPVYLSTHNRKALSPYPIGAMFSITVHHLWLHPAEPCEASRCSSRPR